MVILITGASHTGKTLLAQKLLEERGYPYLSLDHLKMGLIRSGQTALTPCDDEALTPYLWSIAREIVKTAVENRQNLIIEGCYIPFDWKKDFTSEYLAQIRFVCLALEEQYLRTHWALVRDFAGAIEDRRDDSGLALEEQLEENRRCREGCRRWGLPCLEIRDPEFYRRSRPLEGWV